MQVMEKRERKLLHCVAQEGGDHEVQLGGTHHYCSFHECHLNAWQQAGAAEMEERTLTSPDELPWTHSDALV